MSEKAITTQNEIPLETDTFIYSQSDSRGKIIYANQNLQAISGYEEDELLDQNHSIFRHPDMPKAVFKLLWETLKDGKEFNGYVKNRCKNGDFYWVFATINPLLNKNQTIYYSIRKKPSKKAIATIEPLYKLMLEAEKNNPEDKTLSASLQILTDEFTPFDLSYDEYVLSI